MRMLYLLITLSLLIVGCQEKQQMQVEPTQRPRAETASTSPFISEEEEYLLRSADRKGLDLNRVRRGKESSYSDDEFQSQLRNLSREEKQAAIDFRYR